MHPLTKAFENLVQAVRDKSVAVYGEKLISFVVFGSVGRRVMRPDSDIDFLLVVDPLPRGRLRRVEEFESLTINMAMNSSYSRFEYFEWKSP